MKKKLIVGDGKCRLGSFICVFGDGGLESATSLYENIVVWALGENPPPTSCE